jgi:hypothetical protein
MLSVPTFLPSSTRISLEARDLPQVSGRGLISRSVIQITHDEVTLYSIVSPTESAARIPNRLPAMPNTDQANLVTSSCKFIKAKAFWCKLC